jgi:hypothetical protein
MKNLLTVLLAASSDAGWSRATPTIPGNSVASSGSYVLTGSVSGRTNDGILPLDGLSAESWTIDLRKAGCAFQVQTVDIGGNTSADSTRDPADEPANPARPLPPVKRR